MVSGENKFNKDNAFSNGSGKSSIWSGINWVLTGQTTSGLTVSVKNINNDEDLCYVTLFFSIDDTTFEITRSRAPKPNLTIIVDGKDVSGKGLRESENVLTSYIGDINNDLLSNTIILGQSLPNKLSSHSPSGRKDLLEKLSKTDFRISEIRDKISARQDSVELSIKAIEENIIKMTTQKSMLEQESLNMMKMLSELPDAQSLDDKIAQLSQQIVELKEQQSSYASELATYKQNANQLTNKLSQINVEKSKYSSEEYASYSKKKNELLEQKSVVQSKYTTTNTEISRKLAIKDICPTCGQKIPGVHKCDVSELQAEGDQLKAQLETIIQQIKACDEKHSGYVQTIEDGFKEELDNCNKDLQKNNTALYATQEILTKVNNNITRAETDLDHSKSQKQGIADRSTFLNNRLTEIANDINEINTTLTQKEYDHDTYLRRRDLLKKLDTFSKKEFRGYLLSDIVDFINQRAKLFCNGIFNTDELDFKLENNNINIVFCNKEYEALSGGEKQKVDIIIQLSLRDLLEKYFNFTSNILVLDEIFDNLDSLGVANVLNLVNNKLASIDSVFIISHHANELNINYDTEIKVIKDVNGISEVA